jgi:hypothetical protein
VRERLGLKMSGKTMARAVRAQPFEILVQREPLVSCASRSRIARGVHLGPEALAQCLSRSRGDRGVPARPGLPGPDFQD